MSRWKGYAAAGLHFLKTKPAALIEPGHCRNCLLVTLGVLPFIAFGLTAGSGTQMPFPPRKPEMATHTQNIAAYAPEAPASGAYRSPLSGPQMDLYHDIFRTQARGDMGQADLLIGQLHDKSLMGHVLAQRYLHPAYKAGYEELRFWLATYADLPQAARIARLANARAPEGAASILAVSYNPAPIEEMAEHGAAVKLYEPTVKRSPAQNAAALDMISAVKRHVQKNEPSYALRLFNESQEAVYLDSVERDRVRALIASGYFYAGKLEDAGRLSARALQSSGEKVPMAGWINGLVLWRADNFAAAAKSFEKASASPYASGWMTSASAYWAGRAHERAGHKRRAGHWYAKAADHPRTFYGLLALGALDRDVPVSWDSPDLSRSDEQMILATSAGQRAERLIAAGQVALAEAEIRALYISGDANRKQALLAYAYDRGLPSLTIRLAHAVGGNTADSALYPEMPWSPKRGYRIDRALIHAIARQESRFNPAAENKYSGASGLMQLMPRTALHVTGEDMYIEREGRARLKSPELSLDIGQDYIEELLNNAQVGQDLLSLAVAYNAGPGNLAKWKAERPDITDPLLFIETIPFAETRAYVERVLSNYWIYRLRFNQPNESMTALAKGSWARYASHDKGAVKFADAR